MVINKITNKKIFFGLVDREKPLTWILVIIVAMLVVPLVVTLILYYGIK